MHSSLTTGDSPAARLPARGGALCLDFTNTVDWHRSDRPKEWLVRYEDLLAWAEHAGAIDPPVRRRLAEVASRDPALAARVLERAIELREAMYRVFTALASARAAPPGDLARLNDALAGALRHRRIAPVPGGRFTWAWAGDLEPSGDALERPLWPVVASAGELLTSDDVGRVRQCADDRCGWLFIDTSRNRSRRWCSMEECGNRAKARRHYRRTRKAVEPEASPPSRQHPGPLGKP